MTCQHPGVTAPPLLNPVSAVAERLGGISRCNVYNLLRAGDLRAVKVGTRVFVTEEEIARFIASRPMATFNHGRGRHVERAAQAQL